MWAPRSSRKVTDGRYFEKILLVFQWLHRFGEVEGTGIGLSVRKRIAERHAARPRSVSTVGEGPVVHVTLPGN